MAADDLAAQTSAASVAMVSNSLINVGYEILNWPIYPLW